MVDNTDLGGALSLVQNDIVSVNRDLQTKADLNRRYKTEQEVFHVFTDELIAAQGKLKGGGALGQADLQQLINAVQATVSPQVKDMISTNTEVLAMGRLSTDKDIGDSTAKALSKKLSVLQGKLQNLSEDLHAELATGESSFTSEDVKIEGEPELMKPPSLQDLASFYDNVKKEASSLGT